MALFPHEEAATLTCLKNFVCRHLEHRSSQRMYEKLLDGIFFEAREEPVVSFIDLPLMIFSGFGQRTAEAMSLTSLTACVYAGADILDNLADNEAPDFWKDLDESSIHLAAVSFLSTFPHLLISDMKLAAEVKNRMTKILAEGLLKMSQGQSRDLALRNMSDVSWQDVLESVKQKSGEEMGMFAALAAAYAGCEEDIHIFTEAGCLLGTAGQLASDCFELFQAKVSRDLSNGTRTLPIAMYLGSASPQEREHFLSLLDQAKEKPSVQADIRNLLHQKEVLRLCAFIIEAECHKSLHLLEPVMRSPQSKSVLQSTINAISLFPKQVGYESGSGPHFETLTGHLQTNS